MNSYTIPTTFSTISGVYELERKLQREDKYVFAIRHNNDPDTDEYFIMEEHTRHAHDCRKAIVVVVKCEKGDGVYKQALFNSFLCETNKEYSPECTAFMSWCLKKGF